MAHADQTMIKYFVVLWFLGVAIIQVFTLLTSYTLDSNVFALTGYVGYFILGTYLLTVQVRRSTISVFMIAGIALTAIFTYVLAANVGGTEMYFFQQYFSPTVIVASVGVFLLLLTFKPPATEIPVNPSKGNKLLKVISENTLAIYLFHLGHDLLGAGPGDNLAESLQGAAQAPGSDPHLVHGVGLVRRTSGSSAASRSRAPAGRPAQCRRQTAGGVRRRPAMAVRRRGGPSGGPAERPLQLRGPCRGLQPVPAELGVRRFQQPPPTASQLDLYLGPLREHGLLAQGLGRHIIGQRSRRVRHRALSTRVRTWRRVADAGHRADRLAAGVSADQPGQPGGRGRPPRPSGTGSPAGCCPGREFQVPSRVAAAAAGAAASPRDGSAAGRSCRSTPLPGTAPRARTRQPRWAARPAAAR